MPNLNIGDLVQLKSRGLQLTVTAIAGSDVEVAWAGPPSGINTMMLPDASLVLVDDNPPPQPPPPKPPGE